MGQHRKASTASRPRPDVRPPIPTNIGKKRKIISIFGKPVHLTIEDEISRIQSTADHKVITFQKVRFEDGRVEFRFGYYMIGVKEGARGRWVWGQFALLIPPADLKALLKEANKRKWF